MSKSNLNNNHLSMHTLHEYKEKPLYEVPEQYFEQLQRNVMQCVMKEGSRQKPTRRWISAVSIAASIVLIVILSVYVVVNRNTGELFYAHEDITTPENSISILDSNHLAEATELVIVNPVGSVEMPENLFTKTSVTAQKETIVYRAVDFYVDDYAVDSFCEVMYDLECYYDY